MKDRGRDKGRGEEAGPRDRQEEAHSRAAWGTGGRAGVRATCSGMASVQTQRPCGRRGPLLARRGRTSQQPYEPAALPASPSVTPRSAPPFSGLVRPARIQGHVELKALFTCHHKSPPVSVAAPGEVPLAHARIGGSRGWGCEPEVVDWAAVL